MILPTLGMNDVNWILLSCFLFEQIASPVFDFQASELSREAVLSQ